MLRSVGPYAAAVEAPFGRPGVTVEQAPGSLPSLAPAGNVSAGIPNVLREWWSSLGKAAEPSFSVVQVSDRLNILNGHFVVVNSNVAAKELDEVGDSSRARTVIEFATGCFEGTIPHIGRKTEDDKLKSTRVHRTSGRKGNSHAE